MVKLPEGFDYQGIYCYRSPTEPSSFYYIPGAPGPQRNSQGVPAISLFASDQVAILQLSSQWDNSIQLEELRKYLANKFPELKLAAIRLQSAPLVVEEVRLTLKDNAGNPEVLGTSNSSGHPPFSAVFSVQLSNEQKAQAISAFNGHKGFLTISYQASLSVECFAEVSVTGDITKDFNKLNKDAVLEDCLRQIEEAIAQQRLALKDFVSPEAPEALLEKTVQLAKEKAAELLLQIAQGTAKDISQSKFRATATLTETIPVSLERSIDVTSWFPKGNGLEHLQVIGNGS